MDKKRQGKVYWTKKIQQKQKDKKLKYEYKPNVNLLAGWLKNILIAVIFVKSTSEKRELYDIILEKARGNLVEINPNRSYERNPYTSSRNKYSTNIRYNMWPIYYLKLTALQWCERSGKTIFSSYSIGSK